MSPGNSVERVVAEAVDPRRDREAELVLADSPLVAVKLLEYPELEKERRC